MNCPRDNTALNVEMHKGIEVDRCPKCEGIWLDFHELDQLEDTVFDKDELKGTVEYSPRPSDIACPKCQGPMTTFNYRAYNLPIDYCNDKPRVLVGSRRGQAGPGADGAADKGHGSIGQGRGRMVRPLSQNPQ